MSESAAVVNNMAPFCQEGKDGKLLDVCPETPMSKRIRGGSPGTRYLGVVNNNRMLKIKIPRNQQTSSKLLAEEIHAVFLLERTAFR